jgi:hypothetical protein
VTYKITKELPTAAQTVHRLFKKSELQGIAQELDLPIGKLTTRQLVMAIVNDIEDQGIPSTDDCSDDLFEFLLNIDFIDEDGEILKVSKEKPTEVTNSPKEPVEKPECFSFAEIRDPACKRCVIYDRCLEARERARPACFGRSYSADSEECRGCIEASACSVATK